MSQKRGPEHSMAKSESSSPDDKRRKGSAFSNVVRDVMKFHSVRQSLETILEPLLRRVVREEVELALEKHVISIKQTSEKEIHTSESRNLQLQFANNISLPIFTGARIEGEDGSDIRISLVDALTGQVVSSGPESAAMVEIVVLEGYFDDRNGMWMPEEFGCNIVKERDGKKPLLTGDVILHLKEGIGMVGEISFTDNSSWTRSRKFRLGARVVNKFDGIRIREAKTESFLVRDHRGELYKKHHPPSPSDEVWRLEKIGKDGAFHKRLNQERITTVADFLTHLNLDSAKLRSILGTGMSAKMWEVMVEHARTCVLDTQRFLYFPSSQPESGVVFNAVGQVTGLLSESQYVPVDRLSETEKADAQNLANSAIKQGENFAYFDDEASLMDGSSRLTDVVYSSFSPRSEGSSASKLFAPQTTSGFDFLQASISTPDIMSSLYSIGGTSGLDEYCLPTIEDSMEFRYDQTPSFPVQVSNSFVSDPVHAFGNDDHLHIFSTDVESHCHILDNQLDLRSTLAMDKAQRRWRKLFNVLKWFMMSNIASKRKKLV